ncbi:hypothetical protein FB558_5247 [Pseudonocardia kunmingensis]|uniref:Uncharacterized protein n=1 Tax=Pseudonocardia kunmingensis TaxID=630975 RepID=A0A543DJH7_9PSEU|nr:hypothetical protein FB558_5247 [Pseudonocardia kunmingensis]
MKPPVAVNRPFVRIIWILKAPYGPLRSYSV